MSGPMTTAEALRIADACMAGHRPAGDRHDTIEALWTLAMAYREATIEGFVPERYAGSLLHRQRDEDLARLGRDPVERIEHLGPPLVAGGIDDGDRQRETAEPRMTRLIDQPRVQAMIRIGKRPRRGRLRLVENNPDHTAPTAIR